MTTKGTFRGTKHLYVVATDNSECFNLLCYSSEFRVEVRKRLDKYDPNWKVAYIAFTRESGERVNGTIYNRS